MTLPVQDLGLVERRSRIAFHWAAHRHSLISIDGRVPTHTRPATAAPGDSSGVARTVVAHQPAWDNIDWDGDATRDTPALLLGPNDKIFWAYPQVPRLLTAYLEFVENGTLAIASAALLYFGNAGNTGARLWTDSTGSFYRVRHHNGTTEVTSTLAAAPTSGQRVVLRAVLFADGSVQLHQSINGAAETSAAASGANTLAAAWSDTRLYLGTTGDTNPGNVKVVRARIALGNRSAAQMQVSW